MAAAATTRWRDGAGRDWLFGGASNDLLSGDAPASLWQDRPFITFSSPEPGLPIPVAAPLASDVGGNDLLTGGAGDDILRRLRRDRDRDGRDRLGDECRVPSIRRRRPQHLAGSPLLKTCASG
jgi:Ca2+-binding RTX toxin-like protein